MIRAMMVAGLTGEARPDRRNVKSMPPDELVEIHAECRSEPEDLADARIVPTLDVEQPTRCDAGSGSECADAQPSIEPGSTPGRADPPTHRGRMCPA